MLAENNSQLRLFVQESLNRVKLCLDDLGTLAQETPEKRIFAFDRLLRTIRGIGGSARFHALTQIVHLCQSLESFLGRFRTQLLNARPEFASVVVLTLRKLGQLLEDPGHTPPYSIDQEIRAIQSMLAAHADPPEFDLADYPQAVAKAISQGVAFYSLHIPLEGDPTANRHQFEQIKSAVEVVATLIASKPELTGEFEWRDDLPGGMIRLLLSTVLPGEILHGLILLPQERIVRLEIPEALSQAVIAEVERHAKEAEKTRLQSEAQDEERLLAESQPDAVEDATRLIDLDEYAHSDLLEEAQLGESELKVRQQHLEEMQRQETLMAQQRQQASNDEAEQKRERLEQQARYQAEKQRSQDAAAAELAAESHRKMRRRRWIFGGATAAGLLVAAAQLVGVLSLPGQMTMLSSMAPTTLGEKSEAKATSVPSREPPSTQKSLTTMPLPQEIKPAEPASPKPASINAPSGSALTTPSTVPPATSAAIAAPSDATPAAAASPSTSDGSRKSDTSRPLMSEQNNPIQNKEAKTTEESNRSPSVSDSAQSDKGEDPQLWTTRYSRYDSPTVRLTREAYVRFKPAKNTVHGSLRVQRNPDGNLVFSIADMMGHTAIRPNETFKITPDSMSELRLILQVERGHAYVFEMDRDGKVVIPHDFWIPFSKVSKKAVSVSRVVKQGPDGLHLRDLTVLTMSSILRTTAH